MARVVALIPDLMFGSRVLAALSEAGHEVELVPALERAVELAPGADVLVVDLASGLVEPDVLREALPGGRAPRTLGFYSHVEQDVRTRAEAAGFDLVVPRSRMNREGPALVDRLASA